MASPTVTVRIDWNNDGDFLDANENVSARVLGLSWTRGRSADFSAEATGSATITLRNDDALYDPDGATGPTADQLVPGRPVHIYATYSAVDYPEFFGYIERLAYDPRERTVTITAYDPLRRYQETDVVVAANSFVSRSARDMRLAVLDDVERGVRNLIGNPSFETNTTGWNVTNGTITRVTTDAASGAGTASADFAWTSGTATLDSIVRMAPVFFAGVVYRFSVYLRVASGTLAVTIGIGEAAGGSTPLVSRSVTATTTWTRHTITLALPSTRSANAVSALRPFLGIASGTLRLDAASFTRGQALHPYVDAGTGRWPNWVGNGSFDGGALNGWNDGWTNLVGNPSFETDTTGWSIAGDAFYVVGAPSLTRIIVAPFVAGIARADLVTNAGGNPGQGTHYVVAGTFKAGVTYLASIYARGPGTGETARVGIGSNGTPTDFAATAYTALATTLTRYTISWTPSADRTDVHLFFNTQSGTGTFGLDAAQVTRRDPATTSDPAYSNIGPGGGGSFTTTRTLSTTAKYGAQSQSIDTPATAGAGRVYDFSHIGAYFPAQAFTLSIWVRPSSSMPYKVGLAANKGDGTWDEVSTTGTATLNVWTQVTLTWTPSAERSSLTPFDVVLYVYQTDAIARTVLLDGVRVIPGSVADDFEMSHWLLAAETDSYLTTASLAGAAVSALATINDLTLSRHWIKPTMAAPFYTYVTRSRAELSSKVSAETYNDDLNDMTNEDIDRASIINIVPVAYAGGTEYYSDTASVTAYGSRPTGAIGNSSFLPDLTVPDAIGADLLAQYKNPRARPEITVENRWPSQLQRELDDLVTVTFSRLSISAKAYLIARLTTTVSDSGNKWRTVLALEEHIAAVGVAPPPQPPPPLVISNVTAAAITSTSARIEWSLSAVGTGQAEYGLTTAYGGTSTLESSFNFTSHAQTISGLSPGTLYHYRVKSQNATGFLAVSGDFTFTTALVVAPTASYPPVILAITSLVSYWRVGETSGTSAVDGKSTNHGTYTGTYTLGQPGLLAGDTNKAVSFSSGYVDVPYVAALNPAAWSFEAWVRWTTNPVSGAWSVIAGRDSYTAGTGWYLFFNGVGTLVFSAAAGTNGLAWAPASGTTYHIVGTYDGTSLRVYVNGALLGITQTVALVSNTQGLFIGSRHSNAGGAGPVDVFPGTIDEPAFYNAALSLTQIAANYAAGTGGTTALPIGGTHSLRGVKSYTLLTPTATVASPYGLTQIHAARDAAGVNGIVRFPAAGSPYAAAPTMSIAGQTWQTETAATSIAGTVTVTANDCTLEGGKVQRFLATRAAIAERMTLRNVEIRGTGLGIDLQGSHHGWKIYNCEFYEQTLDIIKLWYDQAADPNFAGFRLQDSILTRTAGSLVAAIGGADGNNLNTITDFVVSNCYIDNGTNTQGGFGIEVWGHETNAAGRGGIVEYSELKGGRDTLLSMVRSRDNWIHHSKFIVGTAGAAVGPFSAYECAGPNHLRGVFEYNEVTGASTTTRSASAIYHNSSATGLTVRQNRFTNLVHVVEGCCNGGGYIVEDNCVTNTTNVLAGTGWTTANTVQRNGAGFGPCA